MYTLGTVARRGVVPISGMKFGKVTNEGVKSRHRFYIKIKDNKGFQKEFQPFVSIKEIYSEL